MHSNHFGTILLGCEGCSEREPLILKDPALRNQRLQIWKINMRLTSKRKVPLKCTPPNKYSPRSTLLNLGHEGNVWPSAADIGWMSE